MVADVSVTAARGQGVRGVVVVVVVSIRPDATIRRDIPL
jgi:hypothetical protein